MKTFYAYKTGKEKNRPDLSNGFPTSFAYTTIDRVLFFFFYCTFNVLPVVIPTSRLDPYSLADRRTEFNSSLPHKLVRIDRSSYSRLSAVHFETSPLAARLRTFSLFRSIVLRKQLQTTIYKENPMFICRRAILVAFEIISKNTIKCKHY